MYNLAYNKLHAKKGGRIIFHVLFWLLYYYLITAKSLLSGEVRAGLIGNIPAWLPDIIIFYLLVYIVFPNTIYKEKYLAFVVFCLLTFIFYLIIDFIFSWIGISMFYILNENKFTIKSYQDRIAGGFWYRFIHMGMLLTFFYELLYIIALPMVIKISRDILQLYNKSLQLQKANLQIELNFLKSQLNPHFLFNTLNNLDTLITLGQNKEASETTLRLSQFMRYTLYECNDEFVLLAKEIKLTKNYIELERIRHNELLIVMDFNVENNEFVVPPLILLPFVENAFKYVGNSIDKSKIIISIKDNGDSLIFIIANTFVKNNNIEKGGIGLNNIQRRLQHYYPQKHELSINQDDYWYRVQLKVMA